MLANKTDKFQLKFKIILVFLSLEFFDITINFGREILTKKFGGRGFFSCNILLIFQYVQRRMNKYQAKYDIFHSISRIAKQRQT